MYLQESHNVHKVNGTAFQSCAPPATSVPLTTGNDEIKLETPGRKWYICGVGSHCESGMQKLFITVLPAVEAPAPAPSPMISSAPHKFGPSSFLGWLIVGFGLFKMIIV